MIFNGSSRSEPRQSPQGADAGSTQAGLLGASRRGVRALRTAHREALAFARQAALLHRDVRPSLPGAVHDGEDVVVLLHGLFATAGVLRPLRERVEQEARAHTASYTYEPGPGVQTLAKRLGVLLGRLPEQARIHLVGHSMGGLVARFYVQEHHDPRVAQTISMATPFGGTLSARWMPARAGRDILPGSPVLERLSRGYQHSGVPHLSIVAADDQVVPLSTPLPPGEQVVVHECGHNALLFHETAMQQVVARLRAFIARE